MQVVGEGLAPSCGGARRGLGDVFGEAYLEAGPLQGVLLNPGRRFLASLEQLGARSWRFTVSRLINSPRARLSGVGVVPMSVDEGSGPGEAVFPSLDNSPDVPVVLFSPPAGRRSDFALHR